MIKNAIRTKSYFFKTLAMGLCMISIFSGTALAKSGNPKSVAVLSQSTGTDNAMIDKQAEIDKYVFEEHADEIEKKGFIVIHTGPFDNYVEIGISPFTQENADYLYEIFGREHVKVVEGQQAQLMTMTGGVNTTAVATTAAVEGKKSASIPAVYTMAGFLVIGGAIFALGRHKAVKKM